MTDDVGFDFDNSADVGLDTRCDRLGSKFDWCKTQSLSLRGCWIYESKSKDFSHKRPQNQINEMINHITQSEFK